MKIFNILIALSIIMGLILTLSSCTDDPHEIIVDPETSEIVNSLITEPPIETLSIQDSTGVIESPRIVEADKDNENELDIESIRRNTDNRVSWITERIGTYIYKDNEISWEFYKGFTYLDDGYYKDFYDGEGLVYRQCSVNHDESIYGSGGILYSMYYDDEENLIFACIRDLYYYTYYLYFYNDLLLCVDRDDITKASHINDDDIRGAVAMCLENAYTDNTIKVGLTERMNGTAEKPLYKEDIEKITNLIDERVDWIIERLGGPNYGGGEHLTLGGLTLVQGTDCHHNSDLYDDDNFVFRQGVSMYLDALGGGVFHDLFYGEDGKLIFAEIRQFRFLTYSIYFYNDALVCLKTGERTNCSVRILDEFMINAIALCFENAYA